MTRECWNSRWVWFTPTAFWFVVAAAAMSSLPQPIWSDGGRIRAGSLVAAKAAESSQEMTLAGLGLPAQTMFGSSGSEAISIPAPLDRLAASGTFVRLLFTHTPLIEPSGSTLMVLINGEALTTIPLDASTAAGSQFDVRAPAFLLRPTSPNLLQIRFALRLAGPAANTSSAAYVRLDPQTLFHYQLYTPPDGRPLPRLESYPLPLLGGTGARRVGLLLPEGPTDAELRPALRLAGDLGRRAYTQEIIPEVVTSGQVGWLKSSEVPALLIGTRARLPLAAALLKAAGFSAPPTTGPAGEAVADADGLVVWGISPWDGHTPLLLVSGATDEAVTRAVDALTLSGQPSLSGPYAIVARPGGTASTGVVRAGARILPDAMRADASQAFGAGSHTAIYPLILPPVDRHRPGSIELQLSHSTFSPGPSSWMSISVNGEIAAQLTLNSSSPPDQTLRLPLRGTLLRPGLNLVAVSFELAAPGSGADPTGATEWARAAAVGLSLPPAPAAPSGLELLPDPIFSDPAGVTVVVGRRTDPALSAAARVLAALGSRTPAVPVLDVTAGGDLNPAAVGRRSLVVVGAGATAGAIGALRRGLPGPAPEGGTRGADWGAMYMRRIAPSSPHHALWIDGTSPELIGVGAAVLRWHPPSGPAVVFDAAGRTRPVEQGRPPEATAETLLLPVARGIVAIAGAGTLLTVCWQVFRQ